MSVKVSTNYGGGGNGLGQLMSLYGVANQFNKGGDTPTIDSTSQETLPANNDPSQNVAVMEDLNQKSNDLFQQDPFSASMDAMNRRKSAMVNPRGGYLGEQKATGIAGMIGSLAALA